MKINPEKKAISLIIICLIIGSLMAYFSYNHPRSIREIIKDIEGFEPQIPMYPYHDDPTIEPYPYVFTFRTIKPGTVIPVGGEVTDLEIMHTTYGKLPVLILDHCDDWPVFGKPDKNYKIGEYEVIDFHFREYYYNQDKFVWADELFGIFPAIPIAISIVMKGVSYVGGIHLEPTLLDNEGLTKYVINTHYKFDYPLTLFNASLRKGSHSYAIDYVEATCGYENVIAKIDNLNDTKNENSLLKFYDSNRSGFLDTGDYFVLNLPPTKDRSRFDTYILFINDYSDDCIFMGLEYIINWYAGIFHISEIEMPFEAEDHDLYSHYSIKLISDQKNNSFRDVTLKISNDRFFIKK